MEEIRLSIPFDLKKQLEKKAKETGFRSIEDYLNFILENIISTESTEEEKAYTDEEEKAVKKRLDELGYS